MKRALAVVLTASLLWPQCPSGAFAAVVSTPIPSEGGMVPLLAPGQTASEPVLSGELAPGGLSEALNSNMTVTLLPTAQPAQAGEQAFASQVLTVSEQAGSVSLPSHVYARREERAGETEHAGSLETLADLPQRASGGMFEGLRGMMDGSRFNGGWEEESLPEAGAADAAPTRTPRTSPDSPDHEGDGILQYYEHMGELMNGTLVPLGGFPAQDELPTTQTGWERWAKDALGDVKEAGQVSGAPAPDVKPSLNRAYRFWRAVLAPILYLVYGIRVHGFNNLPKGGGGALLLSNHVSWLDFILLSLVAGRPIRFLMYEKYYNDWRFHWFVKLFHPIPIKSGLEALQDAIESARAKARALPGNEAALAALDKAWSAARQKGKQDKEAFKRGLVAMLEEAGRAVSYSAEDAPLREAVHEAIRAVVEEKGNKDVEASLALARAAIEAGDLVAIFPEGTLTPWGGLTEFKSGFTRIAAGLKAPSIPIFIDGLWGSIFSRRPSKSFFKFWRRKISIRFGRPLLPFAPAEPQAPSPDETRSYVQEAYREVSVLGTEGMTERLERSKKTLPRSFVASAKRNWWRLAVADSTGRSLRYIKLLIGSLLLSGALRTKLPEGKNVGVLLTPSVGAALANIAPSFIGKVAVNLNYTGTEAATDSTISQAGLDAIITARAFIPKFREKFLARLKSRGVANPVFYWEKYEKRFLYIEDLMEDVPIWKKLATALGAILLPALLIEAIWLRKAARSLKETAAIIFTSGTSSSMPKGAVHTHLAIQHQVEALTDVYPLGSGETILGVLPFFHVFGYTVTFWLPLLSGVTTIYHNDPRDAEGITKLAEKYHPTATFSTASFLGDWRSVSREAFKRLKLVVAGAEKLPKSRASEFLEWFGILPTEGYGTSELAPVSNVNPPDADVHGFKGNRPGTVGPPIPGEAEMIVDPDTFQILPPGQQGLLLVRGPNVMESYLDLPEKTAEVLRNGWYVTGDIASMDEAGYVTMHGRLDMDFSKLSGEKVPHADVARRLTEAGLSIPYDDFAVTGVPDDKYGQRLIVLYKNGFSTDFAAIAQKAYSQGMPPFWRIGPASFHAVDEIPLLGSGKRSLAQIRALAIKAVLVKP